MALSLHIIFLTNSAKSRMLKAHDTHTNTKYDAAQSDYQNHTHNLQMQLQQCQSSLRRQIDVLAQTRKYMRQVEAERDDLREALAAYQDPGSSDGVSRLGGMIGALRIREGRERASSDAGETRDKGKRCE